MEQPSSFLKDWMYYNSGDECSPEFHLWSGMTLLGAALGRKVWINHGKEYFQIFPNIYVCLVGTSGAGKSTARARVKSALRHALPDYLLSSNMQSREDICVKMGSEIAVRTWKNAKGEIFEYRQFFMVVNELKNFLSGSDSTKMVDFLVDIYDETEFSTGFKNTKDTVIQHFYNPFLSMLCCATPKWFMSGFKADLFSEGVARRIFIVCRERDKEIPEPEPPVGWEPCKARAYTHLQLCHHETTQGEVVRTPDAMKYWKEIYHEIKSAKIDDMILKDFYESKAVMVLKIALLLSFDRRPFTFKCEKETLETAYAMVNDLEKDVRKLTGGIGPNLMAGVAQQMIQFVIVNKGFVQEKRLYANFYKASPNGERDYKDALNFLKKTEQVVEIEDTIEGVKKNYVIEMSRFKEKFPLRYAQLFPNAGQGTSP